MKKLFEASEEGMEKLMGERITLFCINYIYTGKLVGLNDTCVLLEDPAIIYETGGFESKEWADAQSLPNDCYVMLGAIESFMVLK